MLRLLEYFRKPKETTENESPDGYCPNCWGEQEYAKNIRQLYKDKQVDINNHESNYAFIQEFVVSHIEGIHLKRDDNGFQCPSCKRNFKF